LHKFEINFEINFQYEKGHKSAFLSDVAWVGTIANKWSRYFPLDVLSITQPTVQNTE